MAPQRIGRFEIAGMLGSGGMAVVYRGMDPAIERPAALKVIRKADLGPAESQGTLKRFKREAQAAASLHHPNVVAVYEYGEDEVLAWIAMELVEGRSLRDHLRDGWRPSLTRLPTVLEQLLEALDYSHGRGIVHRDLKPSNVLISEMGEAKISDFGIARIERSTITQQGEMLGTPYYMAPEQYLGSETDERADIYSAGVIVYEVLSGRRPFEDRGGDLMQRILRDPPPPPSTHEPRLPVSLDVVLGRALAKRPEDRYRNAREFLQALKDAFPQSDASATTSLQKASLAAKASALRKALGSAPVAKREAPAGPAARRPAVLFVDDEERVLNALRHLFRDTYEVQTALDGAQGLELLRTQRFHVLVSDQRMPEMPGVELLRQARTLAPGTVRLLLTGYSDLAAIVGSVNDGEVFRFVSKPWQEPELRATIAEAVDVAIAMEAAAASPAAGLPAHTAALVLGDPAIARAARELAKDAYRVHDAASVDAALEILAAEEIAALVCDLDLGGEDPAALLRILKQQAPETQLLAISSATDADTIIGLINEARIHRFLKKPVNFSLLQSGLQAALQRYARIARAPGMLRAESAQRPRGSASERSILGRLKALGGRFSAALRS
jgi:response regulator RpfG family c-di-GMP phosphodiesterase/predicted Ser/Thr protein kinase